MTDQSTQAIVERLEKLISVGHYDGKWSDNLCEYVYVGEPDYWHAKIHNICIRPDQQRRYVFMVKPELPTLPVAPKGGVGR